VLWTELGLREHLVRHLLAQGLSSPTPIQSLVIPQLIKPSKCTLVQAQTGTGKTLAYLLPVISALRPNVPFQVIIMAPTRELAVQIQGVLQMLQSASPTPAFTYCCALPGENELQQDADGLLEKKPTVLIGTPLHLYELFHTNLGPQLAGEELRYIIVDEIDRQISPLPKHAPRNARVNRARHPKPAVELLRELTKKAPNASLVGVAATINLPLRKVLRLHKLTGDSPLIITEGELHRPPAEIIHKYMVAPNSQKLVAMDSLIRSMDLKRALVLMGSNSRVDDCVRALQHMGHKTAALYQEVEQGDASTATARAGGSAPGRWERFVQQFRSGEVRLAVGTEATARGLDFPELDHVFVLEIPDTPREYLHMCGRTGRQGRPGTVITLLDPREVPRLERCVRHLNIEFEQLPSLQRKPLRERYALETPVETDSRDGTTSTERTGPRIAP
jgi:superfamily II DNA/RNA helicase